MAQYSIKDLERLSGIKAHTLRVWEKRYDVLSPQRTSSNIRYYLDEDLQHLLKVVFLYNNGHKISKIAGYCKESLSEKVREYMSCDEGLDGENDALTMSIMNLDRFKVERILNHKIEEYGFEKCLFEVIYPLLEKINLLWITGGIEQYHENFLVQIIKQKVFREIDQLSSPCKTHAPTVWILSNAEEGQDLTLLLSDYYLKMNKFSTVNLGSGLSVQDMTVLCQNGNPDYVLLMFNNSSNTASLKSYTEIFKNHLPNTALWVSGYLFDPTELDDMTVIQNVFDLRKFAQKEYEWFLGDHKVSQMKREKIKV